MPVPERAGRDGERGARSPRGTAACAGWSSCQYVSSSQPPSLASRMNTECWPGAHVAQRARPLAVAREARRRQGVERRSPPCRRRAPPAGCRCRRYSAWIVRTWRSSPEWLEAITASSSAVRSNSRWPPGPEQRDQAERLDRRAEVDEPVRVAEDVEHPAGGVHLDDVAAVDRLHDAVAHLAHEHGRHGPLRARGARSPGGGARAMRPGVGRPSAAEHSATDARATRRRARPRVAARALGFGRDRQARRAGRARPIRSARGIPVADLAQPPRVAAPRRPPQARHPARRDDRAQEVPRGRPRAVVAAGLRGARRRADAAARRPHADRGHGRRGAGRPDRPHPDPARRPGHGRRDAGADAHRAGLAPGPVPRRADAAPGRVLQQAARQRDRRPVPDPRPDARDRRLGDGGDRGPQEAGARSGSSS